MFAKKPLLAKSPPQRCLSLPELPRTVFPSPGCKRKREETSLSDDNVVSGDCRDIKQCILDTLVRLRDDIVSDKVSKRQILESLENAIGKMEEIECQKTGIVVSRKELRNEERATDLQKEIETARSAEEIKLITSKWWPQMIFKRTHIGKQNVQEPEELAVALINPFTENALLNEILIRVPTIKGMLSSDPKPGQIAIVESSDMTTVIGNNTDADHKERKVRRVIIGVINSEQIENQIIKLLIKVKGKICDIGVKKCTIVADGGIRTDILRKIAECIFWQTDLEIKIVSNKNHKTKWARDVNNDTIIVQGKEGESFAEVVAKLKSEVNPEEMGVTVKKLSQTSNGNVKIVFKEDKKGAKQGLLTAIREKTNTNALVKTFEKALIVSELDDSVGSEELKTELHRILGVEEGSSLDVKSLKKNRSGLSTAVVKMPTSLAQRAIKMGTFKVGWTTAKIRELVIPEFCQNCQRFGHRSCEQLKQDVVCWRCGDSSHKAKGCTQPISCFACKCIGHRGDSMKCPQYREAVKAKTESAQRRDRNDARMFSQLDHETS